LLAIASFHGTAAALTATMLLPWILLILVLLAGVIGLVAHLKRRAEGRTRAQTASPSEQRRSAGADAPR
jgi:cytochrome c-type biogenesis protein CcmH/NrfF